MRKHHEFRIGRFVLLTTVSMFLVIGDVVAGIARDDFQHWPCGVANRASVRHVRKRQRAEARRIVTIDLAACVRKMDKRKRRDGTSNATLNAVSHGGFSTIFGAICCMKRSNKTK